MKRKIYKRLMCILMVAILVTALVGCSNGETPVSEVQIGSSALPTSTATTNGTQQGGETNATTTKPTVPTNQMPEPDLIWVEDMEYVGKEVRGYGDVDEQLLKQLEDTVKKYNKNISIAAYSLDGSRALVYNSKQGYFSACTIKMPVMLYCCKQISEGKIDKDTMLTYQEKHYHGGSGKIRYAKFGTKYSIETLVNLGLSISDNVAYEMIVDYIGHDGFNAMMKELGCTSTIVPSYSIWGSSVKVNDYMRIWREVYKFFETESIGAEVLKEACTNTKYAYGVKGLDVDYSHKSGNNYGTYGVHNDAGIIWTGNDYLYAIFTNSEGTSKDMQMISDAAKIVYEIMNS